jgi:hypothetical protein
MKKQIIVLTFFLISSKILAQNVGIGTNTPEDKLTVTTTVQGYGISHIFGGVKLGTYLTPTSAQFGTQTNHPLQFFTKNGSPQMTIAQNGNVGIGTITPADKLSIVSELPGYGVSHTNGPVTMGTYISNLNGQFGTKTNHPLQFFTNNGNAQMTLLQNGNIGIGTEVPQTRLHINPSGAGSFLIGTDKNAGGYTNLEMGITSPSGGYSYLQSTKASGSAWGDIALNPSGGRVSIGTTVNNPNTKLTVSQDTGNYNGIVVEGKGANNSAIYAKGTLGANALVIDGPIRSANTNSKVIYQMVTQTTSSSSDGYLFDNTHPGIPGLPDGHVTILINNPLCNNDPNAMIFYTWIGVYENNKNYQSFLTYDPISGKWHIKYNYDVYLGSSDNQVPAFNIMIVKQ